jgi:hypothetical protein
MKTSWAILEDMVVIINSKENLEEVKLDCSNTMNSAKAPAPSERHVSCHQSPVVVSEPWFGKF